MAGIVNFFKWNIKLSDNLSDVPLTSAKNSKYSSGTGSKGIKAVYDAIRAYAIAEDMKYGKDVLDYTPFRHAYVGEKDGIYYAELECTDNREEIQICKVTPEGTVTAGIYNLSTKVITDTYKFGTKGSTTGRNNTLIILALLPQLLADMEAAQQYTKLCEDIVIQKPSTAPSWLLGDAKEELNEAICIISDNFYRRLKERQEAAKPVGVKLTEPTTGNYMKIDQKSLTVELNDVVGFPKVFGKKKAKAKASEASIAESLNGKYSLDTSRTYTAREKMMIPVIEKDYNVPEYIIDITKKLKASSIFKTPMRNVLLQGPSGAGKTTSSRLVGALTGQPYSKTTCSVDTDIFNFLGQVYPNMNASSPINYTSYIEEKGLPTPLEIQFDPEGSYKKITGKEAPEGMDASEIYSMLIAKVMDMLTADMQNDKDLIYVESDFIKAIRNGYVHEIQEPTVIKRAGVLVGLNALLECGAGAYITLPTGEVVKRHKDCIIIMTTNTDYEGCSIINQSVISRFDIVKTIDEPSDEETVERLKYNTGFDNPTILKQIVNVRNDIKEQLNKEQITDGVCGMREIENWIKCIIIKCMEEGIDMKEEIPSSIIHEAALDTVISKVSQDELDRDKILQTLENTFSE